MHEYNKQMNGHSQFYIEYARMLAILVILDGYFIDVVINLLTAVEPRFISKLDKQKSKLPVIGGGIYSRYTIGDKHENYHLKQTTTGTIPLSQSAKLNLTTDTVSSNYVPLLGRQNSKNKTTVTKSNTDVSSTTSSTTTTVATTTVATTNGNSISSSNSFKEHKRRLPENISPSSVPLRGPDAIYNMSATLVSHDDGEIEVTSVRKSKGKKKKGKKKKKTNTEADTGSKQVRRVCLTHDVISVMITSFAFT